MIEYKKMEKSYLYQAARMNAISFSDYPLVGKIRNEFESNEAFIDFLTEALKVYIYAHSKKNTVFLGFENNKIRSFAILVSPRDKKVNFFDYMTSGGVKLLTMAPISKIFSLLQLLSTGHKAVNSFAGKTWMLELLAVDSSQRGKNYGSKMINDCLLPYIKENKPQKRTEYFITFTNTERNRRFYSKNGFFEFDSSVIKDGNQNIGNWSFKMDIN